MERRLAKLREEPGRLRSELMEVDPANYQALMDKQAELGSVEREIADLEDEWLGLSERLEG